MGNFLLIIPNFKGISPIPDHIQKVNSRVSKIFFPMCISKSLLLENYLNLLNLPTFYSSVEITHSIKIRRYFNVSLQVGIRYKKL